jgi:hypothetical protein
MASKFHIMPPTSGMSDGAQGGTTPEVGCAQAIMLYPIKVKII